MRRFAAHFRVDSCRGDGITRYYSTVSIDLGAGDDRLEIGISDVEQNGGGFISPEMFTTFAYLYVNGGLGKDTLVNTPFDVYAFPPTFISLP